MDNAARALDALIDVVVEKIATGLDTRPDGHEDTRALGNELNAGAAMQALLGPKLGELAREVIGEVKRKTELRYAAYLRSPFYSQEQFITEAARAEVTFLAVLSGLRPEPTAWETYDFVRASIRTSAITAAMGAACIIPPKDPARSGRSGVHQRRREITAADIPPLVANLILAATADDGDLGNTITSLRALETTDLNLRPPALVTKLLALIEHEDGLHHLDVIATRLRRAQFKRAHETENITSPAATLGDPRGIAQSASVIMPPALALAPADGREAVPVAATASLPPTFGSSDSRSVAPDPLKSRLSVAERFRQSGVSRPSAQEFLDRQHARHRERNA